MTGVIVDYFAGGGGWSTGLERAYGRPVTLAVNHSRKALAMHRANHPHTQHACSDVWEFPIVKWLGKRRWLVWVVSPDCTHHSRAKGGKPVENKRRSLANVVLDVLEALPDWQKPDLFHLENVPEWLEWCRLDASGRPDKAFKGEHFREWLARVQAHGYVVEWRIIVCALHGDPTTRKRLFLTARRDGLPMVWPEPSHRDPRAVPVDKELRASWRKRPTWRTAADCIDFSKPGRSIFDRPKPIVDNTLRRLARGVKRFVIDNPKPFIVPLTHHGDRRVHPIDEPVPTITSAHRGELAVITPFLAGVTQSSTPRLFSPQAPLPTITTAKGGELVSVAPVLVSYYGDGDGGRDRSSSAAEPIRTVTTENRFAVASAHLLRLQGNDRRDAPIDAPLGAVCAGGMHYAKVAAFMAQYNNDKSGPLPGHPIDVPASTITTTGSQQAFVEVALTAAEVEAGCERVLAFMLKYYGSHERGVAVDAPLDSITTKDRFALITVHVAGVPYRIFDIRMRMLDDRELFNAQGFPPNYIIRPRLLTVPKRTKAMIRSQRVRVLSKRMSKSDAISMCGNSVPPGTAEAVAKAAAPPMSRMLGRDRWTGEAVAA